MYKRQAPSVKQSCVRPSTSWPPSLCRRTPLRWCSCSRRDHHQHDHRDQQDHQPAFCVAAPPAVRYRPRSSATGRQAAVLTDQPPSHGSVGSKPAASAVLADGDGQGLSISVSPACLALASESASQPVSHVASHRSRPWRVGALALGAPVALVLFGQAPTRSAPAFHRSAQEL